MTSMSSIMDVLWQDKWAALMIAFGVAAIAALLFMVLRKPDKQIAVAYTKDFPPGQMREVDAGKNNKVLLVRTQKGDFHALAPRCTHYKAPLHKGILYENTVTCPWHAACFNVETGDIEDGPVLDALPTYKTSVKGGTVHVHIPSTPEKLPMSRTPHMCPVGSADKRNFVIVGGGAAGITAAQTLREQGFQGMITLITNETNLPYDRPKLSKNLEIANDGKAPELRSKDFFVQHGISVRSLTEVRNVNTASRVVTVQPLDQDGNPRKDAVEQDIRYDKLLCATGGKPRRFQQPEQFTIPGADLKNVFALRNATDCEAINDAVHDIYDRKVTEDKDTQGINVVIVGSSFIGMEAASYFAAKMKRDRSHQRLVANVTVIGMEEQPFERVLGRKVGKVMKRLAENAGITFYMKARVNEFLGDDEGNVSEVELQNSPQSIVADVVVIGAGIIPATDYLEANSDITFEGGAVVADSRLKAAEDVYVAGDIAKFTFKHAVDKKHQRIRVEHWDVACDHGRVAAKNMLGNDVDYDNVPFFWTQMFGVSLRYSGNCMEFKETIIHGDLEGDRPSGIVYYVTKDDLVAAVLSISRDPYAAAALVLLKCERMPSAETLRDSQEFDLPRHLSQLTPEFS